LREVCLTEAVHYALYHEDEQVYESIIQNVNNFYFAFYKH